MHVFLTGGTLDKHYNELNGELTFTETHMQAMLQQARMTVSYQVTQLMLKDSLEMTDTDRQCLAQACLDCDDHLMIVAHGTDTMVESAAVIAQQLQQQVETKKVVVLFGAMLPFELSSSDALFNLGTAVAAVQLAQPGVYITMNGQVFPFDQVQKNRAQGRFENTRSV